MIAPQSLSYSWRSAAFARKGFASNLALAVFLLSLIPARGADEKIQLRWLDSKPAAATGVTWGVPWPKGTFSKSDSAHLRVAGGRSLPVQSWPLAYWPDGSVKWLGVAAVLSPADGDSITLVKGAGPAPSLQISVRQPGIEVIREVDTGVMKVEVGDRGQYAVQQISRGGRSSVGGISLVGMIEKRQRNGEIEVRRRENMTGIIENLTVEQSGPIRAVFKLTGKYRSERSGRMILPFVLRLVFYAGSDSVELVHSFTVDIDSSRDFIAALGVKAHVLLHDGLQNRHIRIVGEDGKGVWTDSVRMLPYNGHEPSSDQAAQRAGRSMPPPPDGGLLPVWNEFQLFQDSADHAILRKRQASEYSWVVAEHCRRAPGILSLSEPAGGLAIALRDFWQAHPSSVEIRDAGNSEASLLGWWWPPSAEPMDLRHYGGRDHRPTYEARNPDPKVYSSAFGISRTSQMSFRVLPSGSTAEDLRIRHDALTRPPLLVAEPEWYHASRVFGHWSPANRSTPAKARIESELESLVNHFLASREQHRWYGFWDYGDFMHTYDVERHAWQFDQGGRAWDNTELGSDLWIWLSFIRTGNPAWYRFAEAMTRHVSEVDVFHLGPWTAQGSRHNVVHWGDPCKEPRVSQAGAKRFFYFLTADERTRDLLDEVSEFADQFKATNVPTGESYVARVGPTWAAWVSNWLCAWERTGDTKWRDKIVRGIDGILRAPYGLLNGGDQFDYDPRTGAMTYRAGAPMVDNRLTATMGGAETWMELADLLEHPGFKRALADYGSAHALPLDQAVKSQSSDVRSRISLIWANARLMAWAGLHLQAPPLKLRAWEVLLRGDADPREPRPLQWPFAVLKAPPIFSAEPRAEIGFSTNDASTLSLNLIASLALAGEELERAWGNFANSRQKGSQ